MSDEPDVDGACEMVKESGLAEPFDSTSEGDESTEDVSGDDTDEADTTNRVVVWPESLQARFTATFVPRFSSSIKVASFSGERVEICDDVVFCCCFAESIVDESDDDSDDDDVFVDDKSDEDVSGAVTVAARGTVGRVVCWETCWTTVCFVSPLSVFEVMPDATIVIVLLLVFDIVLTFFALSSASASARRRVADRGAPGTINEPCIEKMIH